MRLLNTKTFELEMFPSKNSPEIPDYAILSHTWGDQEVVLQEYQAKSTFLHEKGLSHSGYQKIAYCCRQAALDGFGYAWVDTCCIDKTNHVELSEAINSMFRWYQDAQVCYAYLVDVPAGQDPSAQDSSFRKSRWFTRGWTLQELLAPISLVFYDKDWNEIGTKPSLQDVIVDITGVSAQVLLMNHSGEISVAQRMSWASGRETTRVEDEAYCLMGLFGVSMPMIYGEGCNAFVRLQQEILKLSDDHSIFAWAGGGRRSGLLARSPREFSHCRKVRQLHTDPDPSAFFITNRGLQISLPLMQTQEKDEFVAVLNCYIRSDHPLGIYLKKKTDAPKDYDRVRTHEMVEVTSNFSFQEKTEIYIKEDDPSRFDVAQWMQPQHQYVFTFLRCPPGVPNVMRQYDDIKWDMTGEHIQVTFSHSGISVVLLLKDSSGRRITATFGVHNYHVWCGLMTGVKNDSVEDIAKRYWDGDMGNARWLCMDRMTKPLPGGQPVTLAVKKGAISGENGYLVELDAEDGFFLAEAGPGSYDTW